MQRTPAEQVVRLQAQIARLEDSMASGLLTVEGADGTGRVTYQSYAVMRQELDRLHRKLARIASQDAGGPVRRRARRVVMVGRSGF